MGGTEGFPPKTLKSRFLNVEKILGGESRTRMIGMFQKFILH